MSCRGKCDGAANITPTGGLNVSGGSSPSHQPVHISMQQGSSRQEPMARSYAEYTGYGNIRIPPAARASTPGPYDYRNQYDTFGPQLEYNLNWMPKDINLSDLLDQTAGQEPSRFGRIQQQLSQNQARQQPVPADITPPNANPLLINEQARDETSPTSKKNDKDRETSLMEWFDKSVEKELKKHKSSSLGGGLIDLPIAQKDVETIGLSETQGMLERIAAGNASQIEICANLRQESDTELTDAVDKFAKAQAMCAFASAVKAAECAADSVPPELVEEAALASARDCETDLKTSNIHGELEGVRPIEIVGYAGVTKPKYPVKRQ